MKDSFWFQHDSNARSDARLLELRAEMGWEGYGLWWGLVEKLREATDYSLSNTTIGGLAMDLAISKVDARKLLDLCISLGLLEVTGDLFCAPALCRRMERWDTKRQALSEAGKRGAGKRWAGEKPNDTAAEALTEPPQRPTDSQAIATPLAAPIAIREDKIREDKIRVPSSLRSAREPNQHFESFWLAYPRKEAKATALKSFEKLPAEDQALAAERARDFFARREDWDGPGGQDFRPHPATWLNQARWNDLTELTIIQPTATHADPQRNAVFQRPTANPHGLVNRDKYAASFAILRELGL